MKKLLALVLLAVIAAPARADFDGLFDLHPGDVQGLILQAQAQRDREQAERLTRRATKMKWGLVVERRHDERCTLAAVARRMGVQLSPAIEAPEVIYESLAEGWEFQSAHTEEHGMKAKAPSFTTTYYPKANKIFIADGVLSNLRSSVDQAVAGEYARFVEIKYRRAASEDAIKRSSAAIRAWFGVEHATKPVCAS